MTDLIIRVLRAPDLPAVLEMVQALAAHHGDTATLTLDTLARDTLGEAPWLRVLVAEQNRRLVGYAALCPMARLQFGARAMDMHHLFVAKDQRGKGVGRALITETLEVCRALGCVAVTVGTDPENKTAAKVYKAAGFTPVPPQGPRFRIWLTD